MNLIQGIRQGSPSASPLTVYLDGQELRPDRSQKIYNHSPPGFNAGYGGSGVAQLALAILLECTTEENARQLYQDFKWEFLANPTMQLGDFKIAVNIKGWVKRQLAKRFLPMNTKVIEDSGIPFKLSSDSKIALFRETGKPAVDFFLETGRWRIVGRQQLPERLQPSRGEPRGAWAFLDWYKELT